MNAWDASIGICLPPGFSRTTGTLTFADAPDFQGTLTSNGKTCSFWGDFGQISSSAFVMDVLPLIDIGDLWITVYDEYRQVVIEFTANIGAGMIPNPVEP